MAEETAISAAPIVQPAQGEQTLLQKVKTQKAATAVVEKTNQEKVAFDKAAQEKVVTDKAAQDKIAADKIASDKAAADKGKQPNESEDNEEVDLGDGKKIKRKYKKPDEAESKILDTISKREKPAPKIKAAEDNLHPDEKYKPFVEKSSKFDKFLSSKKGKAFYDWLEANPDADINDFATKVSGINPDKLTVGELISVKAKSLGLEGEELSAALTEEQDYYDNLSTIGKREYQNKIKEEIKKQNEGKFADFSNETAKTAQDRQAEENRIAAINTEGTKQLEEKISGITNQKVDLLDVTPEMANEIKDYVMQYTVPIIKDGKLTGYDIDASINNAVNILYIEDIKQKYLELGKKAGYSEGIEDRLRPSENNSGSLGSPAANSSRQDIIKNKLSQMNGRGYAGITQNS